MLLIKTMALEKFPNPTHAVVNDKQLTRREKSMFNGICIAGLKINTNSRYFFYRKKNIVKSKTMISKTCMFWQKQYKIVKYSIMPA